MMCSSSSFVYFSSDDQGIYYSILDEVTGAISEPILATLGGTPGSFFLAAHPSLRVIYSLHLSGGLVIAYSIRGDGMLVEIARMHSGGDLPCHLAVTSSGRYLVVANYRGGVSLFSLASDGGLGVSPVVCHMSEVDAPFGVRDSRPHGIAMMPGQDSFYVADLGSDCLTAFCIREEPLRLEALSGSVSLPLKSGPRHVALSPSGLGALVINEFSNTVTGFIRDEVTGRLMETNSLSTLPKDFTGESWSAEVVYHPAGNFCYASNRGHDSLAIFATNEDGQFRPVALIGAGGRRPQHLAFDRLGKKLFVSNQSSDEVAVYPVDPLSGLPSEKIVGLSISKPACVLLVPWELKKTL